MSRNICLRIDPSDGLRVALGVSFDVFGVFLLVILLLLHPFRSLRRFIYGEQKAYTLEETHA